MDLIEVKTDDGVTIRSNEGTADELRLQLAELDEAAAPPEKSDAVPRGEAAATDAPGDTSVAAPVAEKPKPDKRTREGKKASIQSEIDELSARHGETQREYEVTQAKLTKAREELAALENRPKPAAAEPQKSAAADDPEPQIEQFLNETDVQGAYYRALAKWEGRQETRRYLAEQRRTEEATRSWQELQTTTQAKQATTRAKLDEAAKSDPTLMEKITPLVQRLHPVAWMIANGLRDQVNGATAIADSVLDSEAPDRLLLHFVEHPEDEARISQLPVHLAMREMGKLESRVCAADRGPAARPIIASAAPPPSKPLGGAPVAKRTEPPGDDASDEEWESYMAPIRRKVRNAIR